MTTASTRHQPAETVAELLDTLEDRPALAVDADLTVHLDGTPIEVTGYEDVVALDFPSLSALRSRWQGSPVDAMDMAAVLSSVGLTAEIRVRGVPLARVGDAAVPGRLAGLLGLGPVELVPEGALLALVTRRRG